MNLFRIYQLGWIIFLSWPTGWVQAELVQAQDADGKVVALNPVGQVTVVLGSNDKVAQATRDAGRAGDEFQGRADYRCVVVVDLRDSLGNLAPPVVRLRMRSDLNAEAVRITPFYRKNGNPGDPRREVSCVPDFSGDLCKKIGWEKPVKTLRAVVFGRDGQPVRRWEDLQVYTELQEVVRSALAISPKP